MKIGLVGLGRMGNGIAERLRGDGHTVVGYDLNPTLRQAESIPEMVNALDTTPKVVWLMVPAGNPTQMAIDQLCELLSGGDIVIDGGNSHYKDSLRRAEQLAKRGIDMLDCGTSGGVWGLKEGFCLMVGGQRTAFDTTEPIFETLAPKEGYAYLGPSGAGHFAKMVHNGIEYGMLQSYAEGFQLMQASQFDFFMPRVASLWNHGSVIRSWLLELAENALQDDPWLERLRGYVDDSGEGRWTVEEAVDRAVPLPAISAALYARFASREDDSAAMRFIAALRNEFGGHAVKERDSHDQASH